jgi:hypothetical protein
MKQIKQFLLVVTLFTIFANVGWGQWIYDFGTGTGSYNTASGSSTTFFSSTPANGGTYRVRCASTGNQGAGFVLANPGTTLGTGTELQINAAVTTSTSKFGVYDWTAPSTTAYMKFKLRTTSSGNGTLNINLGVNTLVTDNNGISSEYNNSLVSLSIIYAAGSISSVTRRISGSNTVVTGSGFSKDVDQVIEIYGNNGAGSVSYIKNNTSYTLATKTWDLWVDGVKTVTGAATAGTLVTGNLSGLGFFGESSTSNVAFMYLDDLEYSNALPTTYTAPTTQASSILFSGVTANTMTVGWTNGNGSNRTVFMKEESGAITNPSDGTTYTASSDWNSKGTQLGSSGYYCVYNGSSNTVNLSNLLENTTYWIQIFEYNGTGASTKYYTATATNNPLSQKTISLGSPTITLIGAINAFGDLMVNTNSVVQNYSVSGSFLTSDIAINAPSGFELSSSNSPFTPVSSITLTNNLGTIDATTIYVRFSPLAVQSYSGNITHISTDANSPNVAVSGNGTAVPNPATFTAITASSSQINLAATANANSHNIVVVYNASGTFTSPTDGVAPGIQGDAFVGGTIWYKGTAASLTNHTSLSTFQTVYYKTFSYDALNFYSAGLIANATTLKIAPTTQASAITFPTVANTSMTINWTNGDGDRRVVLMNTSNSFTDPVDGATITTSTTYSGSGEQCIYNSTSNTVSVTGLTAGTVYWFRVYEYNNTGLNSKFLLTTGTNNPNSQVTNTPAAFLEDFEAGTKTSYATGNVTCTMGSWSLSDAVIGTGTTDRKNGLQSVRLRDTALTMNTALTNGARDVTIYHAKFGTDNNKTWKLQKSVNSGPWIDVGTEITTSSTTLTTATFNVNQPGNVKLRIISTSSTVGIRVNIDDITITDYDKTITTSSPLPLTEYGNLTINGSGINVTLAGNTTVNGTLTFTNGKLTLGTNNLTLGSSATVTGSTSSNYIVTNSTGVLTRNSVGGTETLYPIGTVAAYSPVWITNTGISDNISVNVEPDVSGTNNGDDRVKLKWNISEGILGGSVVTLKIGWLLSQEGALFSSNRSSYAKLWHLENNNWTLAGNGENVLNTSAEPYTLYSTNIQSFSPFGSGLNESAMPVTLSSLTNSVTGRNIKLNWTTASEINNAGFDVERLCNRQPATNNWEKIGYVSGKGTTNNSTNYSFDDRNLQTGKYNYRLKQIDHNGNFEYFSLNGEVEVGVPAKFDLSQNYPNPFNPVTKINFDLPFDSKVNISLYDITGREVKSLVNESRTAGYHTVQFNASDLSSGVYFYRIITKSSAKDFVMTKKLAVIK